MGGNPGGMGADRGFDTRLLGPRHQNFGDAQQRQLLAVALGALRRMFAAAFDKVDDLVSLDIVDHLRLHGGTGHQWRADGGRITPQHQDIVELQRITRRGIQQFHPQHIAAGNLVLFAAGFQNREHGSFPFSTRILWPPLLPENFCQKRCCA